MNTLHPAYTMHEKALLTPAKMILDFKGSDISKYLVPASLFVLLTLTICLFISNSSLKKKVAEHEKALFGVIELIKELKAAPAPVSPGTDKSSGFKSQLGTTTVKNANLRSGPGTNYPVILTLSDVTNLSTDIKVNGWYKVSTPTGSQAFISEKIFEVKK